jgi:hypothetical protein
MLISPFVLRVRRAAAGQLAEGFGRWGLRQLEGDLLRGVRRGHFIRDLVEMGADWLENGTG